MTSTMGLQQQAASHDTVDFASYLQSTQCHQTEGQVQGCQKSPHREHNSSFTSTKGLLNGPGQNNCFLNSAVQIANLILLNIISEYYKILLDAVTRQRRNEYESSTGIASSSMRLHKSWEMSSLPPCWHSALSAFLEKPFPFTVFRSRRSRISSPYELCNCSIIENISHDRHGAVTRSCGISTYFEEASGSSPDMRACVNPAFSVHLRCDRNVAHSRQFEATREVGGNASSSPIFSRGVEVPGTICKNNYRSEERVRFVVTRFVFQPAQFCPKLLQFEKNLPVTSLLAKEKQQNNTHILITQLSVCQEWNAELKESNIFIDALSSLEEMGHPNFQRATVLVKLLWFRLFRWDGARKGILCGPLEEEDEENQKRGWGIFTSTPRDAGFRYGCNTAPRAGSSELLLHVSPCYRAVKLSKESVFIFALFDNPELECKVFARRERAMILSTSVMVL
ncbi:hypothetical protein ALC53_04717 [Atta colombica]|uniref:Uncharacterized protein n=1 Tax=Atta colombica TaxID=520822 RepID=A0A195BL27_9HYME|nr:hypothetical protein ALC53_04717 [Atta colombica]